MCLIFFGPSNISISLSSTFKNINQHEYGQHVWEVEHASVIVLAVTGGLAHGHVRDYYLL